MSKKTFVSVNTKYYHHSNASGEMAHVFRKFLNEKNVIAELTKNNFGDGENVYKKYLSFYKKHNDHFNKNLKRSIQKNAVTFVDSVLVFSLDQFEHLEKTLSKEELEQVFTEKTREYMEKIQKEFGLTPIGFNAHLDEGHEKNGVIKRNIHFHLHYYNYDFEKNVAPWRKIGKKQLSMFQTYAAEAFSDLGFTRGVKNTDKPKKHLEKDQFLEYLAEEKSKKLEHDFEQKELVLNEQLKNKISNKYNGLKEKKEQELKEFLDKKKAEFLEEKNKEIEQEINENLNIFSDLISLTEDIHDHHNGYIETDDLKEKSDFFKKTNEDFKKLEEIGGKIETKFPKLKKIFEKILSDLVSFFSKKEEILNIAVEQKIETRISKIKKLKL